MSDAASGGKLYVIGLGPGPEKWVTPEAAEALASVEHVLGYAPYVRRLVLSPHQIAHETDNREELDRAHHALGLASSGSTVALVSGGDPGVFAMAAAVFEAVEAGPDDWRQLDIQIVPGVTAMLAAAARLGAPLGGDFCAINLSNNLKPQSVISQRLKAAAEAGFAIALYNPASKARPRQIFDAFELLRSSLPPSVCVMFARAIGRPDEAVTITSLAEADLSLVDMQTLVLIGTEATRVVRRDGRESWVYTPRRVEEG